jgi:hypothetical protein
VPRDHTTGGEAALARKRRDDSIRSGLRVVDAPDVGEIQPTGVEPATVP